MTELEWPYNLPIWPKSLHLESPDRKMWAKIENAVYSFKENVLEENKKEVLWNVDRIGPHEEIEVGYNVEVK